MKKILISIVTVFTLLSAVSCDSYLDVNKNVDAPDWVEPNLRLAPILAYLQANYWDMRMVGSMCQYFTGGATSTGAATVPLTYGAQMDANRSSDLAEVWKMVYYMWGQNLENMISDGKKMNQPLYAGLGLALKAYGWYELTSLHGEAPCKEFLDPNRQVFDYDSQEYILNQSISWAKQAVTILNQVDNTVYPSSLSKNDLMYSGDKTKWLYFAHGVLAKIYMTMSTKNAAYLDSAITEVNASMKSSADDATVRNDATGISANSNFFGVLRANISNVYSQSDYMVDLMTGREKYYDPNTGNYVTGTYATKQYITDTETVDPRAFCYFGVDLSGASAMPTPDKTLAQSIVGTNVGASPQVSVFGSTYAPGAAVQGKGRWLFRDDAPYVVMTYAELQFIKAEAQFRKGDKGGALTTFQGAVAASLETTKRYIVAGSLVSGSLSGTTRKGYTGDIVTSAQYDALKNSYLSSQYVNGLTLSNFELSHIMMQKYVALYPWGLDTWNDLRRYHYDMVTPSNGVPVSGTSWTATTVYHKSDVDPARVYKGFYLYPANVTNRKGQFVTTNLGSPSYRLRPRYNSEYMWNKSALDKLTPISGLALNYETSMIWFSLPKQ